jgi:glycosyltransferase involved in cell wall biosynthesis
MNEERLPKGAPLVTVGIPFYNAERTLADAIRSVFAQTLTDWELILMDDGSTDAGLEIARSITDPRVRVVSDGRNLRLAARLNQIARLARGKYLARMDADDMMHRDRLVMQAEFLDRNPTVDVVGTGMYILDADGHPVAKRLPSSTPLSPRRVLAGAALMHATVMGRTAWFRRNPYDPACPPAYPLAEDFELWCRASGQSRFANFADCYYYCSEHASFSLSKYATASRSVVRAQWRHGPRQIGFWACCVLSARQRAKLIVYAAAVALRVQGRLIAQRSTALAHPEIELVAADIARIRSTNLPTRLEGTAEGQPGF